MRVSRSAPKRKCPICHLEKRLVGDHCHASGEDRDAICSTCNAGLGMFGDDPETIKRAAEYLERWRAVIETDELLQHHKQYHRLFPRH